MLKYCLTLGLLVFGLYASLLSAAEYSRFLRNYSVEDGLSQSYVTQTLQDDHGYLWIATDYGLNRFNGYDFEKIQGPNNVFSADGIIHLKSLSGGQLLVSTYYTGAYIIDTKTLAVEKIYDGSLSQTEDAFLAVEYAVEHVGTLYFAIGRHLVRFDWHTKEYKILFSLAKQQDLIRTLWVRNNSLYFGSTQGLYHYNIPARETTKVDFLPAKISSNSDNQNVKYLSWHDELGLMVGTVNGLFSINIEKANDIALQHIDGLNIWGMVAHESGYYIASERGLFTYSLNTQELTQLALYSEQNQLVSNNKIRNIFQDQSGLLWLGSDTQGVYYWHPAVTQFSSYSALTNVDLSSPVVTDMLEIDEGILWVATDNGLNKLDLTTRKVTHFFKSDDVNSVYGSHHINGLFLTKENYLWLWHREGLALFDPHKERLLPSPLSEEIQTRLKALGPVSLHPVNEHQFALLSYEGHFLLDINTNTIVSLDTLNQTFQLDLAVGFTDSIKGHDSVLYSYAGELFSYNYVHDVVESIYKLENYQVHDFKYVSDILKDDNGHFWLAVNGYGIVELDPEFKVLRELNYESGLPENRVFGVESTPDGQLWFSTQSGLYNYDKKKERIRHYTTDDGLISNEVYRVGKNLSNGAMAINSVAGIIYFYPHQIQQNVTPRPVKILDLELKSQQIKRSGQAVRLDPLNIKHDDFGLTFRFSNFDFAYQDKTRYLVELHGQSHIRYEDYQKNEIEFTRLLPGKYQFSVSAYSNIDNSLGPAAHYTFEVAYNPWQSPAAITAYVMTFLAIFGAFYWRRSRQREAIKRAHEQTLYAKQRADLALEASNSGIWVLDGATGFIYQERMSEDLGHPMSGGCSLIQHLELIHPDDRAGLDKQWLNFSQGKLSQWDATYRLKDIHGNWVWYRDLGRLSSENNDHSEQVFTGTYSNISESKAKDMQVQLYGEALRKMNEWLLILDLDLMPVTSNKAFNERFLATNEQLSEQTMQKVFSQEKLNFYLENLKLLKLGERLRTEDTLTFADGAKVPVLISVSAIGETVVTNYVVVISDLSQQKMVEEKLTHLANYDPLTQLANRNLIKDRIDQAILHANNSVIALLFIDLDRFKKINDSFGHSVGDSLLVEAANRMLNTVGVDCSVGRQSGDEFIILFDKVSEPDHISHIAAQLNQALAQPYLLEGHSINVSSSIGIAFHPFDAQSGDDLVQNADLAMIHAKNSGRNCYRFFTEKMNQQVKSRLLLENDLAQAIVDDRLTNFYQPIINMQQKKVIGVELLLRWFNHGKMISPAEFIPIIEQIGQIALVTENALSRSLVELATWLNVDKTRYVSINLSALHISQDDLAERLSHILAEHGVSARQIRLEITEGLMIDDTVNALKQLEKLKSAGFKLFLDDFGTGYSSLTYINQFPIDVIKIDQSFIRQMTASTTNQAIVQTIANLAKNLGSYCVAEGVEEMAQIAILKRLGCYNLQGYFFAKPMPVNELLSEEVSEQLQRKIETSTHV